MMVLWAAVVGPWMAMTYAMDLVRAVEHVRRWK